NLDINSKKYSQNSNDFSEKKTDFENELEKETKSHLITKYGETEIYRLDGQTMLHYKIPVPKANPSQKMIINTLKEATTRIISTDPYKIRDPLQRRNIYYQKVIDILENASEINIPKHLFSFYADSVVKEMTGYGVLEPLLNDDKLEEIMVVGPNKPVYVYHVDYGMMTTNITFYSDNSILEIIDKISRTIGRQVDISTPLLDARLPDGSRVNATIPPASLDGSTITIRKFREDPYTITDLVKMKTVNLEVAGFLWCVVDGFGAKPSNILISGGTGSGKTTTLNVLANFIPESDRVLTIEDTAELQLPIKHVVRFEGRPPGLEGKGELSLEILTKNTLRMRPDRIIVGEIRHKEASTLFTAMNTGHDGCMGTIHANSAKETLVRITSPPMNVPPLMLAGIDFIIIQKRLRTVKGQVRRITSIAEVTGVLENKPAVNIIFKWNPESDVLERTENPIYYFEIIKTYTNLSDSQIKQKIEKRINILKGLVNNNIRDLKNVSNIIQEEYIRAFSS
ncbi:CpaF family protein, partial [bacterium]|nr:CpaF family protein [bacterium]